MYFDTIAEYDAEIAAFRLGLRNLALSNSYHLTKDGVTTELRREGMDAYRSYLKELISERDLLQAGDSAPVNRLYATSGRGR